MTPPPPRATRTDTLLPSPRSSDLEGNRALMQVGDAAVFGDKQQVERDLGVLHPEALHLRAARQEQHARVGRQALAEHQALHRSEEHTSELQSLMRSSYAVFCLKKKKRHRKSYHMQ